MQRSCAEVNSPYKRNAELTRGVLFNSSLWGFSMLDLEFSCLIIIPSQPTYMVGHNDFNNLALQGRWWLLNTFLVFFEPFGPWLTSNIAKSTIKPPKFGNGPYLRHLFSDNIFPGIKVVDTISKSKRLLLLSSITVEFCVEVLKCHILIYISFVFLTKQYRSEAYLNESFYISKSF